jgi:hypothetical protein
MHVKCNNSIHDSQEYKSFIFVVRVFMLPIIIETERGVSPTVHGKVIAY